ncbi:MAG: transcriptional regulator, LuxR family [Hyphomicrobiales bacterium]|nr:transcriptional regulator, LuxR family [Hyphomicrobiales bacterium]
MPTTGRNEDRIAVLTTDALLAFAVTSLTLGHFPTATVVKPELDDVRVARHLDLRGYSLIIVDAGIGAEMDAGAFERWSRPFRDVPVLLLSATGCGHFFDECRDVRPLPRDISPRGLTEAIRLALTRADGGRGERQRRRPQEIDRITATQWRVIGFLGCGCSNKEIAFRMGISEATVKAHVGAAIARLGLTNRTEVALFAQRLAMGSRWAASAADVDAPV